MPVFFCFILPGYPGNEKTVFCDLQIMDFWIINLFLIFLLSIFLSGISIPEILLVSFKKKLYDSTGFRKLHHEEIPRLGGLAFVPTVMFAMSFMFGCNLLYDDECFSCMGNAGYSEILFTYCAIVVIFVTGLLDDLVGLRYRVKFLVQAISAGLLIAGGLYFGNFHGFLGINELPWFVAYPLTVFIVIGILNAINFIDGVDGLAASLGGITFFMYGCIFVAGSEYYYAMMAFSLVGAIIPFFYYNVFGDAKQKKKIFMGDGGSLSMGLLMCMMGFKITQNAGCKLGYNPIIIGFSTMIIPCLDVVRLYFLRVKNGKNPFLPDNNHIHHKLLNMGFNHLQTMMIVTVMVVVCSAVNILVSAYVNISYILAADLAAWILFNQVLTHKIKMKK